MTRLPTTFHTGVAYVQEMVGQPATNERREALPAQGGEHHRSI
jgi:hypothetical protein